MLSVDASKRGPFERLFDTMVDPSRRERAVPLLLAGYAAAWWLYAVISNGSQDINVDMGEVFAWSHQVTLGTPKHPPLATWLVRAWFSVMPVRPWAYYLFAVISATVALWIAWRISARYLSAEKRVVGLVLLTFVPFYNFHALRFNANAVLIPFWALMTLFFLRSFATRRAEWAALAGAGAATARPGATALKDTLSPAEAERRMIVIAFAAPFLLAALTGILLQARIGALWTMSGMTLLPVALLSSPRLTVSRQAAVRLLALAVVFPLLMVAVSPGVATVIHRLGVPGYASHYGLIAHTVQRA